MYKSGDLICFKETIATHVGRQTILEAHTPVIVEHINKNTVWIILPNGRRHNLRYIEDRMYPATELGKVLYAEK